jgi:hypothetical protein
MEVWKCTPMMAFAPSAVASSIIRSMACSRDWAIIFVYSWISPPTMGPEPGQDVLPRCLVRMVFPRTRP